MDFRRTKYYRRMNWYGAKRLVKQVLSLRIINILLVKVIDRLVMANRVDVSTASRFPIALPEVVGRADGAQFVMLDPGRCSVAKELYWAKGSLPRPADRLALDVVTQLSLSADYLVDVGANTGLYTLACTARNPTLRVHAFEIVPDIFKLLFENCVRNGILDRVTCHHCGIGNPGSFITVPAACRSSALPSSFSARLTFDSGVRVAMQSLDLLLPMFPECSRVLMKVDVEGTENDVFRNGAAFLASLRPDILCEVLPDLSSPERLEELVAPHGYRFYLVSEDGLVPMNHITAKSEYRDWLFTTRGEQEFAQFVRT